MCQLVILAYNAVVPESDTVVADLVKVSYSKPLSVEWRNSKGKYKEELIWKNALNVILFSKNGSPFSVISSNAWDKDVLQGFKNWKTGYASFCWPHFSRVLREKRKAHLFPA